MNPISMRKRPDEERTVACAPVDEGEKCGVVRVASILLSPVLVPRYVLTCKPSRLES